MNQVEHTIRTFPCYSEHILCQIVNIRLHLKFTLFGSYLIVKVSKHAKPNCLKSEIPALGGGKKAHGFPPPPAIFGQIHVMIDFLHYFLGCNYRVITQVKKFLSPVSTTINTFQGTVKNGGYLSNQPIFQNSFLSREIRDLRTCNPGVKKFLNFLKNCFLASESGFNLFTALCKSLDICK